MQENPEREENTMQENPKQVKANFHVGYEIGKAMQCEPEMLQGAYHLGRALVKVMEAEDAKDDSIDQVTEFVGSMDTEAIKQAMHFSHLIRETIKLMHDSMLVTLIARGAIKVEVLEVQGRGGQN